MKRLATSAEDQGGRPAAGTAVVRLQAALALALMLPLAACAGGPDLSALGTGLAAPLVTGSLGPAGLSTRAPVPPSEAYVNIGRGANTCWFGVSGTYKRTHVLYAEAAPPAQGGAVEVVVHERDHLADRPFGSKAFRITLTPSDGQSEIATLNLRMPAAHAERMTREVMRWAQGDLACSAEPLPPWTDPVPQTIPPAPPSGHRRA
jgi:hypothetical protein